MAHHETFDAPIEQVLCARYGYIGRCGVKRGQTCARCAARRKRIKRLTAKARRRETKREAAAH